MSNENYYTEDEKLDEKLNAGETIYLPAHYVNKGYTDTFYEEQNESGAGSFLLGALVGGVIGAAAALFLAPKTGKEMREDLGQQANEWKEKSPTPTSIKIK